MGFLERFRPEKRAVTITQNATPEQIMAFFGLQGVNLPGVTSSSALRVPAVMAAVTFLSRTLATLDLGAFRETDKGPIEVGGRLKTIIRDAPNPEWSSYAARVYFWQNVFLHGRGLFAILRQNGQPYEIWPMNSTTTTVQMDGEGRKKYTVNIGSATAAVTKTFVGADVIDVPFMLAEDQCNILSPIRLGERAIQLALAMNEYGSQFFAGGGVPPLAVKGPPPAGKDAMERALKDIQRAVQAARDTNIPITNIPSGYELVPIGFDPEKGQMTEARLFQIQEIARVYQIPPVFLQDLSKATFSNAEQQDLHLVKHLIGQWAAALEQEMNLKLFGQMNGRRYVRHDIDSLLRGDFKTRMEGLAAAINGGLKTPNEGRRAEGLPEHENPAANDLFIQGATVPLGSQPQPANGGNDGTKGAN